MRTPCPLARRGKDPYRVYMQETTVDRIYNALLERIVTGDLQAGAPLRQDHIAREYVTSHVPVREALLRLEARGLAISMRHRGTRVTDLEPTEIREIIEMRIALETLALTHALPHLADADLVYAAKARDACDAAETMAEWDRQDRLFHMALLKPCAMPRLLAAIEDLHISASRHVFSRLPERRLPRADLDHADLLAAVGREDLPEATAVLRRHLRRVG